MDNILTIEEVYYLITLVGCSWHTPEAPDANVDSGSTINSVFLIHYQWELVWGKHHMQSFPLLIKYSIAITKTFV